jgi:hypothetical protein
MQTLIAGVPFGELEKEEAELTEKEINQIVLDI